MVIEWGVQYLDGKIMKRFSRTVAEEAVAFAPGRVLVRRVDGSPWTRVDNHVEHPPNDNTNPLFFEEDSEPHTPVYGAVAGNRAAAFWGEYPGQIQIYEDSYVQEPISFEQAEEFARALLAAVAAGRAHG